MEMAQGQSLRAAKPDTPPIDANLLLLHSARESNLAMGEAALATRCHRRNFHLWARCGRND